MGEKCEEDVGMKEESLDSSNQSGSSSAVAMNATEEILPQICRKCGKLASKLGGLVRHLNLSRSGCREQYSVDEIDAMKQLSNDTERERRIRQGLQMTKEERNEKKRIRRKQRKLVLAAVDGAAGDPAKTEDLVLPRLVHPAAMRRLKPLEKDIPKGSGTINIPNLNLIVQNFRDLCSVKKLQGSYDMILFPPASGIPCTDIASSEEEKMDLQQGEGAECFPEGFSFKPKPVMFQDVDHVEAFVALAMGRDSQTVEVRYLLHRDDITLEGLRDVMHVAQSVTGHDLYEMFTERQNVFYLNPANVSLMVIRDRYCKEIADNGGRRPDPPKPLCAFLPSNQTSFVDQGMADDVPHHQMRLNERMLPSQTAALGVQVSIQ